MEKIVISAYSTFSFYKIDKRNLNVSQPNSCYCMLTYFRYLV